ncbi:MAG: SgcJ/EcaC family oxidoreductase [Hyphomonadaceae bacterium]|nr:SgcJ/EcaC family oxidoreductase [Hyphomonadaceae bacterium]
MGVASPELMAETFIERFNARDAAGMLALYEPDGVFTFDGVQKAVGHEQIAEALAGFLASPFTLRGRYAMVHASANAALCSLKWEMMEPEGWINSDGVSMEVLTRGSDGLWRFAVDDATAGRRAEE